MQASPASTSNTPSKEYLVERLSFERLSHLEQLYESVYKRKASHHFFSIKYNTSYTGQQYLGFIAYKENMPIAYYGVVPCFLQYRDQKILAAQSADTMTHPQFRQKGMFVELAKMTFDLCKQSGVKLIFGFPNQNFYRAAPKLNWDTIHTMNCFIVSVKTIPLAGITRKTIITSRLYHWFQRSILKKHPANEFILQNSVVADGYCGVVRDELYMNSKRYYARVVVKVGEAHAWCRISNDWMTGDMRVTDNDIEIIVKKMKRIAALLGLRQIQFHASPGTSLHALLSARYPSIPSFPVIIQDFGAGISHDLLKFTLADIDIF